MNVYVVIVIQTLLGGATHIIAKSVTNDVDAVTLTFLRSLVSIVSLVALLRWRGTRISNIRKDWKQLSLLGVFGTGNQLLYMYGLHLTTAANGALLYATTPAIVLVFSKILLGEKITTKKSAGIVLAFLGVSIVIFERGISLSSGYTYGNLVVLLAVFAWSMFTVLGKAIVIKYGALQTISLAAFIGGTILFPFGVVSASQFHFSLLTSLDWVGILYLGIGTSAISYLLWYYALRRIEASKLAVFSNGQPIVATLLAILFLQYTITLPFLIGGSVAVTGVVLTQRSS